MVKIYCDKCGTEISCYEAAGKMDTENITSRSERYVLCRECCISFESWLADPEKKR